MAAYTIQQIDLSNQKQVKTFLRLPEIIYKNNQLWVPPLQSDATRILNIRKNPFFTTLNSRFLFSL